MKGEDVNKLVTFEPPNTIFLILKGELDENQAEVLAKRIIKLTEGLDEINELVDMTNISDIPAKSRKIVTRLVNINYNKVALFGASTKMRVMGGLLLKMMPTIQSGKFFETEEEARAWLAEK